MALRDVTWTREPPSLPGVLYGWVFPKLMMVLIICCTYVVIAPLLAPAALLYFCAISWHFRYLLYYVHIPMYESGGQFWYSAVPRLLFGLTASNLILIGYLMVIGCTTTTPFMLPLRKLWGSQRQQRAPSTRTTHRSSGKTLWTVHVRPSASPGLRICMRAPREHA